jgi:Carboxypeptidase regulatory-like domain
MRLVAVASCACLAVTILVAQTNSGAITGFVVDQSGGGLDGAPVEAKSETTGTVYAAKSTLSGAYAIAPLPFGRYDISVAVPGFERRSVTIADDRAVTVMLRFIENTQLSTIGDGDPVSRIAEYYRPAPPEGPAPRTHDGKPDLSGVWRAATTIDAGNPVMLPMTAALIEERRRSSFRDLPSAYCLPDVVLSLLPFKFVQTPGVLIVLREFDTPGYQQIFLDGRSHPVDPFPTWYGHSIGRWDGDSLIVDTVGFNGRRWLTMFGRPLTERGHTIDRYRRPDLGHLEIETTIDDPSSYKDRWTIKRTSQLDTTDELMEYVCPENNKDVPHLLGK